mmetsp:Transcript_31142/g.98861  ORF Transcript_31142/g.98861 Transcript_31142/m.98861 type:complete len:202 (-) Transcript_31142:279-884(-)
MSSKLCFMNCWSSACARRYPDLKSALNLEKASSRDRLLPAPRPDSDNTTSSSAASASSPDCPSAPSSLLPSPPSGLGGSGDLGDSASAIDDGPAPLASFGFLRSFLQRLGGGLALDSRDQEDMESSSASLASRFRAALMAAASMAISASRAALREACLISRSVTSMHSSCSDRLRSWDSLSSLDSAALSLRSARLKRPCIL